MPDCDLSRDHSEDPAGLPSSFRAGSGRGNSARRALLFVSFLVVGVKALPMVRFPLGGDHAVFLTLGQCVLDGGVLYQDCWDTKSPGIFFLFALIVKIFGVSMWGMRVADLIWLFGSSYLIFRFAERFLGPLVAAVSVVVSAFWYVDQGYWYTAQTESFLMVFVFLSFFLAAREKGNRRLNQIASGMFLGIAFWFKYNNLAFIPLATVVPYLDTRPEEGGEPRPYFRISFRHWVDNVMSFSVGFGGVILGVLGYFWIAGGLDELLKAALEVVPRYAAMGYAAKENYTLATLDALKEFWGAWTEAALAIGLLLSWRMGELRRYGPVFWAALIGLASAALQVRLHPYYLITAFPFFAMVWGYITAKVLGSFRAIAADFAVRRMRMAQGLMWVLLAVMAAWPLSSALIPLREEYRGLAQWKRDPHSFYLSYPGDFTISHLPLQLRLIRYLRENSAPDDSIFFWGFQPLVYFLSERPYPSRFISTMPLVAAWGPPEWREELLDDLKKSPPEFFIVGRDDALPGILDTPLTSEESLVAFPPLASFVAKNYEPVKDFGAFLVYRSIGRP